MPPSRDNSYADISELRATIAAIDRCRAEIVIRQNVLEERIRGLEVNGTAEGNRQTMALEKRVSQAEKRLRNSELSTTAERTKLAWMISGLGALIVLVGSLLKSVVLHLFSK